MIYSIKQTIFSTKNNEVIYEIGDVVSDKELHDISVAILSEDLYTEMWNYSKGL